jgi:hypothetical protein
MFQLGYELSDACTSIVMQASNGDIYHARNLDFGAGMGFSNVLKNSTIQVCSSNIYIYIYSCRNNFQISYQKNGKVLFTATTFGGYLGVLSGMKAGVFSGTVDTRFYPGGVVELFEEVLVIYGDYISLIPR